jgi:hypothetical protein
MPGNAGARTRRSHQQLLFADNQEEQRFHQPEKKPPSATAMPAMANM